MMTSPRRSDLPHCTAILRDAGLVDVTWFTDHMRERGTALHMATEIFDAGEIAEYDIDPQIAEPLERYQRFVAEMKPTILAVEEDVEYPGLFCGRLDRRVVINGVEGILDIKGCPSPADPIQLAGYAMTFTRTLARWNLYLRAGGSSYKLVEHKDRKSDDSDWRAAIRVAAWRRKHGLIDRSAAA